MVGSFFGKLADIWRECAQTFLEQDIDGKVDRADRIVAAFFPHINDRRCTFAPMGECKLPGLANYPYRGIAIRHSPPSYRQRGALAH